MATTDVTSTPVITTLTHAEVLALADRLYSRAISTLSTSGPVERRDLVTASRALRRLLSAYERVAGYEIGTILLCGGLE